MVFNNLEVGFNNLIIKWNRKINLVSRKKENVFDLIVECREFLKYINPEDGIKLLDLGTGGGFPGVVIKIHRPETIITLVDSIGKKTKAVADIVHKLGLNKIEVICSRAEELSKTKKYKNNFDYITARSVAKLQLLAVWSKGLLKSGGKLITIKGNDTDDEIKETKKNKFVNKIELFPLEEKRIIVVAFKR